MSHPRYTSEEIARKGQALYEERLRGVVDARDRGKFLVVDIETGEYELDVDELAALQRAKRRNPDAALYILRIGYTAAYRIGRGFAPARP
jgi:hypothetical protein